MIKVLIVDDSPIARAGVTTLLACETEITVVGQAHSGEQGRIMYRTLTPDVVLTDLRMPGLDGLGLTRLLVAETPPAKIILLTHHDGDENVFQALRAGALGYLPKEVEGRELVQAIHAVAAGKRYVAGDIAAQLAGRVLSVSLTPRELQVLTEMGKGLTNPQIAHALSLAPKTVAMYVSHILEKLEVRTRTEAVATGLRRGFLRIH